MAQIINTAILVMSSLLVKQGRLLTCPPARSVSRTMVAGGAKVRKNALAVTY